MTDYENEDADFHYENCTCGLIDSLGDYNVPDDGEW